MVARLVMFNCLPVLFGFSAAAAAFMIRVHPKPNRFEFINRINRNAAKTMPWLLAIVAAVPLVIAIVVGKELLASSGERALSVALAAVLLLVSLGSIWRSLRAPKMSREEMKKSWCSKSVLPVTLAILGLGVIAYFRGRVNGFRVLGKAAAEARALVARHPDDQAIRAGVACERVFRELCDDEDLGALRERIFRGEKPEWPAGAELSRFAAARREVLARLETLTAGPAPEFALHPWGSDISSPWPREPVFRGLHRAGLLLDLAAREALAGNDPVRAIECVRTRFRLGTHAGTLPGRIAAGLGLARPDTLGIVLASMTAAERGELTAYARGLAARREATPREVARAVLEDSAGALLWTCRVLRHPKKDDEEEELYALGLGWVVLPLYGSEGFPEVLPRARRICRIIEMPFGKALAEVRPFEAEREEQPSGMRLLVFQFEDIRSYLARRASAEQCLGAFEAACALRLYALDEGRYPGKLSALAPKYVEASLFDPKGPVRLTYQRTAAGCKLVWREWKPNYTVSWPDMKPVGEPLEPSGKERAIIIEPPRPPKPARRPRKLPADWKGPRRRPTG